RPHHGKNIGCEMTTRFTAAPLLHAGKRPARTRYTAGQSSSDWLSASKEDWPARWAVRFRIAVRRSLAIQPQPKRRTASGRTRFFAGAPVSLADSAFRALVPRSHPDPAALTSREGSRRVR